MIATKLTLEQFLAVALPYNISTYVYTKAQQIQWARYLNGFMIHNTGTTNVIFNGDVIVPGQAKSVGGNYAEIYTGRLDVSFSPVGAGNSVTITQKFYNFPE